MALNTPMLVLRTGLKRLARKRISPLTGRPEGKK
jgi:hypothetical protein